MRKRRALGAHIYAGGHSLGAKRAGFDVVAHLEEDAFKDFVEPSRRNLKVEVRLGVDNWKPRDFGRGKKLGDVDWLFCNPPCAAWSAAGVRKGAKDDRARMTERCFGLIEDVQPSVFTWECVTNVLTLGRDFALARARQAADLGYDVHFVVFEASDLGLPSFRKRFFFVASRVPFSIERGSSDKVTVRQAWRGLGAVGPGQGCSVNEKKLLDAMPVGSKNGSLRNFADSDLRAYAAKHGKFKIHPAFSQKRLRLDEPSYTVMGGAHLWHPTESRRITVKEQQVLAGYPKDYEFTGSIGKQYAQIGCAVTPTAGEWMGRAIKRALDAEKPRRRSRPTFSIHDLTNGRFERDYADLVGVMS